MRLPHKVCCQSGTARIRIVSINASGAKGSVIAHAARQSTVTCSGTCKSASNDSKGDTDGVQAHATHSQQRASRRQARALLANRMQAVSTAAIMRTSSTGTATSVSSSASNNGASSGGGVLVATIETNSPAHAPGINRGQTTHHRALVLDSGFRPINVVTWVRAVMLDVNAKADVLEYYQPPAFAYSGRGEHPLPAVVRVHTSVNLSELVARVSCTRRNIMIRDKFQCQYCGARRDQTLDHVVPVSHGGKDTWTNLVTACGSCNQKKADKPLSSLQGWRLRTQPREPRPWEIGVVVGLSTSELDHAPEEWEPYIEQYRARQRQIRRDLRAAGIYTSDDDDDEYDTSGWS